MTAAAVDAHADGGMTDLNDFGVQTVFTQRRFYLLQTAERVSVRPRTTVDH
jgi:hypothetical protein